MGWIRDNFGSKLGLARTVAFQTGWYLHPLARTRVDLTGIERLVFVCKGNICRSALAESVARAAGFPAISYGFLTTPGKQADPQMQEAAAALGYDLSMHQTTRLNDYSAASGDLVLIFESRHLRELEAAGQTSYATALLGSWARPRSPYIHDPYGGSPAYYSRVAGVIRQSVLNLLAEVEAGNAR